MMKKDQNKSRNRSSATSRFASSGHCKSAATSAAADMTSGLVDVSKSHTTAGTAGEASGKDSVANGFGVGRSVSVLQRNSGNRGDCWRNFQMAIQVPDRPF
jgi:hypothetical protein